MDEAEALADCVVVVDAGRVVASGSPAELLEDSGDSLRFDAAPGLDVTGLTAVLAAGVSVTESEPGRYLVEGGPGSPVDAHAVACVTAWCARNAVRPTSLHVGRRSLEDLFLELTGRQLR
jgi:ABC-2 type transport system ATP-binding protein